MSQCGQRGEVSTIRPFATQKPTRPIGFKQLRQGISNKLQTTAVTTTAISNAQMARSPKLLGPEVIKAPARRRKAIVPVNDRLQRRMRYWRIVIAPTIAD
jgi:hypothetical protein